MMPVMIRLLLFLLRNQRVSGENHPRHARGVLQRRARHLRRVNDPPLHQIPVIPPHRIVAVSPLAAAPHLVHHHRRLRPRIAGDNPHRLLQRILQYDPPHFLIARKPHPLQRRHRPHISHPAPRHNPLLHRRPRRRQRILHPRLAVLQLRLRRRPHLDHRHPARQLRQPLLQLFLVILRRRFLNLHPYLLAPPLDHLRIPRAAHDRSPILGGFHPPRLPHIRHRRLIQTPPPLLRHHLRPGKHRDILQHRLPPVAEPRRLHRQTVNRPPQLVHHQHRQRLALHILRDNHQIARHLQSALQRRHQLRRRGYLLVRHQNMRAFNHRLHPLRVGDEVRADVTPIEVHPLHILRLRFDPLALLDRHHPLGAHLLQHIRQHLPDFGIIGRNRRHLRHLIPPLHRRGDPRQFLDHRRHPLIQPPLDRHRIRPRRHVLHPVPHQAMRQHRGGRSPVPRHIVSLAGRLLDQLRPHILKRLRQLHLLGDGNAVIGNHRRPPLLLQRHIPPLGPQSPPHRVRNRRNPMQQRLLRRLIADNALGCHPDQSSKNQIQPPPRPPAIPAKAGIQPP